MEQEPRFLQNIRISMQLYNLTVAINLKARTKNSSNTMNQFCWNIDPLKYHQMCKEKPVIILQYFNA
jgi:hypothetical protein